MEIYSKLFLLLAAGFMGIFILAAISYFAYRIRKKSTL